MDISAATREQCRRALSEHSRSQNIARTGRRRTRRDRRRTQKANAHAMPSCCKLSSDQQLTTAELRRSLKVDIRDYYDAVQGSTRYPGGMALRFARVVRYRDDKGPAEADTIDTVRQLYERG